MSNGRILVVDDELDIVEVLRDRLESWGFHVQVGNSAEAAYGKVEADPPDLVILDVQMPKVSGLDALVELKRMQPNLPVLILSASTAPQTRARSEELGAEGFMLKPFDVDYLRAFLKRHIPGVDL